ncbi:MAG: hypothetical protein LBH51_07525 [Treponema sp.]|nr:hypothetical protein [Treponema sp.]
MMNRTKYAAFAGIVLILALAGCSQDPKAESPKVNTALVGGWADKGDTDSYLKRELVIKSDGAFEAKLNPLALGVYANAGGASAGDAAKAAAKVAVDAEKDDSSWHVTGKLTPLQGAIYKMDNLKARDTDIQINDNGIKMPANTILPGFSGEVTITLAEDGASFTFAPAPSMSGIIASMVDTFFGGDYFKGGE